MKARQAGDHTVVARLSAAGFIGGECRVPLTMRGIPQSALRFARKHWGCLWRTVLVLPLLSHGRQAMGWWVYLALGITWLQRYARYRADSSSKALAGDGRKEINESPRISTQPFLLSRGFVKPLTNERTENTHKALVITVGLCFKQIIGGMFSQL